jgi:WD40 repeat protein
MRFALTAPGVEISSNPAVAVSSDGRTIVFAATTAGVIRLYARTLDDPVPRALSGTEGANGVALSPDSRWVLFSSSDDRVKRVPLEGGRSETLVRTPQPAGLTWNETLGRCSACRRCQPATRAFTIPAARRHHLTPLRSPSPERFLMHHELALADGNTILFSTSTEAGELGVSRSTTARPQSWISVCASSRESPVTSWCTWIEATT